ncbi:hypothetical protein FKP32DRAFT_1593079 [Trametes sanguinea]|nr:hypothetical protein FKP32DRAFT_1593079 [Trametes sanguinea]
MPRLGAQCWSRCWWRPRNTVISESLPEPDSVVNTPMTTPGETTAAEAELALPSELAGSTSDGSSGLVPPVVSTADDILAELSSEESEDDEDEGWIPKGSGTPNNTGKTKKTVPVVPITPTGSKASGAVKSAQGSSSVDTTKSGATKTARPKGK